ncbi:MAG: sigma-54-dependent Fis family transcriptional regulator [Candidatus Schekmanbacteria bacterium]|nr:sigma-54-dependent Fis family transcriptional regulator [Candidatus Schekmanbacteria bacterium]
MVFPDRRNRFAGRALAAGAGAGAGGIPIDAAGGYLYIGIRTVPNGAFLLTAVMPGEGRSYWRSMNILIVEDDTDLRESLVETLSGLGHSVASSADAERAVPRLGNVDLLITDVHLPGMTGLELLKTAKREHRAPEVLVMSGYGTIAAAVEAMREGARGYLTKPLSPMELMEHVRAVSEVVRLRDGSAAGRRGMLVGCSAAMARVFEDIDLAATSAMPVLISGETGSGKELAASAVHELSARRDGPFVAVNLGALPRELADSELFGHEKGAFTGALQRRRGRFALAKGGSLFLDEANSLPLELQPKLLRALEPGEVWPVGADRPEKVDVRIIAATNTDIERLVLEGRFREDLFYRLNVLRIHIPPLRERPEDIPIIATELMLRASRECANGLPITISGAAIAKLLVRQWPGNVRELLNVLHRGLARSWAASTHNGRSSGTVTVQAKDLDEGPKMELAFREARGRVAHEWARRMVTTVLKATGGNVAEAARRLRMSRTALIRLVNQYELDA